uniref:SFRICE_005753 n=1 Tax=Spodoptera frugiperda TaxID=7108 RepID=A0A2H1W4U9_SPOFR
MPGRKINIYTWLLKPIMPAQSSVAGSFTHNIINTAVQVLSGYIGRKIKDEISRARRKRRVEKILENRRNAERPETLPAVIPMGWDCRPKKPSDPIDIPRRHWKLQSGYRPREYC